MNELQDLLDEAMQDPEFLDALEEARARMARATYRLCPWGQCEMEIDPLDRRIYSSVGVVGCPCDYLPGWRSSYYDGLPKPGFAVKAKGRHKDRVLNKRRREQRHARFLKEIFWDTEYEVIR